MADRSAEILAQIPNLRRYAMALVRNTVEAEDLVQDCLCRAVAAARPFSTVRDVRAYLFTIMHNLFVDQRSRQREATDVVSDELVMRKLTSRPAQIDRIEFHDLCRALDQLSPEQKEVLLLVGLEGFTYQATANILGLPIGTVMSRLSRARETLRKVMNGERSLKAVTTEPNDQTESGHARKAAVHS